MTWRSLFYAKVQIKSDKLTPLEGIILIMEQFNILFGNLTSFFGNLPFSGCLLYTSDAADEL